MRSYWIHGWATDSAVFDRVIGSLESGLREKAAAMDLPGFGSVSAEPEGRNYYSECAARILTDKGEAENVALVGWSMGAMVALGVAEELGAGISRLVLISACAKFSRSEDNPHGMDRRIIRLMARKLKNAPAEVVKDFHHRMFYCATSNRFDSFRDTFYPRYLDQNTAALEGGLHYLEHTDLRCRLTSIRCPVLVIHANADTVIDIRLARELNDSLLESRLVVLEDSDHIPFWGAEKRFASLIGDFLPGN